MCKKSIESLVSLLEEEEAAEAKKRPKIVKLPDPTIFTITSPSQWQRNKLKSPDIESPPIFQPDPPPILPPSIDTPDLHLNPPQDVPECSDVANKTPRIPIKLFLDFEIPNIKYLIYIEEKERDIFNKRFYKMIFFYFKTSFEIKSKVHEIYSLVVLKPLY